MSIRVNNIVIGLDEDIEFLKTKVSKKLSISQNNLRKFKILKESIDARKKNDIRFNYSVEVECDNESKIVSKLKDKDVRIEEDKYIDKFCFGTKKMQYRPIIIGMGPAGMFAGLLMAKNGYKPIIIERGQSVEERTKTVDTFWKNGILNVNSNVQFGEGGAGTFSDGKLTTRVKDKRCDYVLEELVKSGAPEEIMYMGKPHVGTDILKTVVKNIRQEIIKLGGEILFNSRLEELIIRNKKLEGIIVNDNQIPCENLILAIGHSSRDTYEMLCKNNILMSPKAFAVGVRIEHSQRMLDENQYGSFAGHPKLRASDYRLTYTSERLNRGIYTFCMCPGGEVVAAASEEGRLVTNGMSYYKRDKDNSNSAMLVTVNPEDFQGNNPLKGMEFQRHYEALAYKLGGGNYIAPIQLVGDFLEDRVSTKLGNIQPTYEPGYAFRDLRECLPGYVAEGLKEGIINFDKKIKGFASNDAIMTGIETRTSAPVRIERNELLQSCSVEGLYPAGEGAGYAGGIISAAVDGIKVAESIMTQWKSF